MTADTMTDTTKPTGDTIDVMTPDELLNEFAAGVLDCDRDMNHHIAPLEPALARRSAAYNELLRRLAERPDRAVARGDETEDCVAINRSVLKLAEKVIKPLTIQATPGRNLLTESNARFVHEQIIAALTTPTETTDPAMERDDAE